MSMSTTVVGIVPPDETWQKMKAVWDACEKAGVPVPVRVLEFFHDKTPDPKGVLIDLGVYPYARSWSDKRLNAEGIELDLSAIPPDVKMIRFYNSW